jgi:hypothetical protein
MGRSAWAFDIDGCLFDSMSATSVRPLALDVLSHLQTLGVPVVVWSAGGADYARRVITRARLDHFVDGFYEKVRGPDGRWQLEEFADQHRPSTCVDDDPEGVPSEIRVLAVPPYIAHNPHNRGFAEVLATARAESSPAALQ